MTSISPAVSLSSSESNLSSCSEYSVEANSDVRVRMVEGSSECHQDNCFSHLTQHVDGVQQESNLMDRDVKNEDGTLKGQNTESLLAQGQESGDSNLEQVDSSLNEESGASPCEDEMNSQFWEPPEPEDVEEDVEGRVGDDDDEDDDCGDATSWGKPISLGTFGEEERSDSHQFKEEKAKALEDVMNGKFKTLVGQLLKSAGVVSLGQDGDQWIDVVTSLSWEAAKFVRPGFAEGKAMDPDGYVKIKCVATGSPQQSHVIKGLVFKKHAAHKHMATKYKSPRLLLIQGALGLSTNGLSSFESMKQEKDSLKAIGDVIDNCQPNVVLVEKTVSRDIQETILAKKVTLVLDMKLHRLERIARCTGSPILSADMLTAQKLWKCDSFHIEKYVEEHVALAEGGKRPSKTLMFLEGCPTRLGCTVLLMGADSDQLKRIKCALRCAVVMAHHFLLETYFLLDLKSMFSTMPISQALNLALNNKVAVSVEESNSASSNGEGLAESGARSTTDIPISNGFHEGPRPMNQELETNSSSSFGPYNPLILSGLASLSASLKRVMGDSFPLFSSSYPTMSMYFGFDERQNDLETQSDIQIPISPHDVLDKDSKPKLTAGEEEPSQLPSNPPSAGDNEPLDRKQSNGDNEDNVHNKDDIKAVLDSESILVLMSMRNAAKGTLCEHSHFSHIKFYRNFDIPLGKYLRDNLLNQKLLCKTCREPPEAHYYYHAHHNKQLTIQVRRLPVDKSLPGESEGKMWMWSRCGKCKSANSWKKSTKRVLISKVARGLSFGKFLELSFSNPSTIRTKSDCGHSLHKDFLYFFGLGTMVAMFKYSRVSTYSVGLPPSKLDFGNSMNGGVLKSEFKEVYTAGISMFLEVEKFLEEVRPRFSGMTMNLQGTVKEFSDVEDLLNQERAQFEVDIQNAAKSGHEDMTVFKFLKLNRLRLELLLESCVWDRRLLSLNSANLSASKGQLVQNGEASQTYKDSAHFEGDSRDIPVESGETVSNSTPRVEFNLATSGEVTQEIHIKEVSGGGRCQESIVQDGASGLHTTEVSGREIVSGRENGSTTQASLVKSGHDNLSDGPRQFHRGQSEKVYPISTDSESPNLYPSLSLSGKSQTKIFFNFDNEKDWIWTPFIEIRQEYVKDIWRGFLPKFQSITSLALDSTAKTLINNEGSRLHIPLGTDDYIVSDFEDEFSSIIACALALIKDLPFPNQDLEEDTRKEKGETQASDSSESLSRMSSFSSPHWLPNGSSDLDGSYSWSSTSSEESLFSSFDGSDLMNSLVSSEHPAVSMGVGKLPGKRKYSVVCLYASQFRQLRNRCCRSECGYIASLSRCRGWDAKGGKSNSVFSKTLDDRFIIKEIQRTEFDSFMKFAPNYFDYMNQCYELGNQTCLAKILGIYQVVIRPNKHGKETRHNLMVMENLSFGRSISRQYDLKGALYARFKSTDNGVEDVLLDQNFVNDMNLSPLYVIRKNKRHLQRAVWNDTTFLNSINVMDYSLLVGVDETKRELVCGIIDYLRQYTWDKQLETWVKTSLVVPKNYQPTIISPKEYKKRFRKFIDTHFLSVPDHWCSQRLSNPCRLCGGESDDDVENASRSRPQDQGHDNDSH